MTGHSRAAMAGVQARFFDRLPGLALRGLPLAVKLGRRTQKRLRARGLPKV